MPSPPIPPPEPDPTRVFENFRRARAGKPIAEKYKQHLAGLTPRELSNLEEMAAMHDAADREMHQARMNGITVIDDGKILPPIAARTGTRARGAGRPAGRRSHSTRAGPDDSSGEPPSPALRLAKPKAILTYAILPSEQRGAS